MADLIAAPILASEPADDPMPAFEWRPFLWAAARWISPMLLVIGWEVFARSGRVTEYMLPPLSAVLIQVGNDVASGDMAINIGLTLYRTFFGFSIAAALGVALGVMMSRSRIADWFFDPLVSVGFPMPKIAFLPVFILWFGLFDATKITIIVVSAIFPVVSATVIGLQGVEREIIWSARSLGASERRIAWDIVIPAALPQVLTGLQVALPTALIVTLVSEMLTGGYGLGGSMMESSRLLDLPRVFAGIVEIALVGQGLLVGMVWLRRRLLVWHQETLAVTAL